MHKLIIALVAGTALLAGSVDAGAPLRITFSNASPLAVKTLEVRIAGGKDWGANRLGRGGLAAGAKTQVLLADGADKCVVDLQFETSDGANHQLRMRMCEVRTFTFNGRS